MQDRLKSKINRLLQVPDSWGLFIILLSLFIGIPLFNIALSFLHPQTEVWKHLVETSLFELIYNSFVLVFLVLLQTAILGVSLAWFVARFEFFGKRFFSWALLLPLAVPAYVMAFVYFGTFEYTSPLSLWAREQLSSEEDLFLFLRQTYGLSLCLSLVLYPYVYLITKDAFLRQSRSHLEAAQSLGYNSLQGFRKIHLPMAWPWISSSLLLVAMESFADFGAVSIFNYDTFTLAIYKAWFSLFSLPAAEQLSATLIGFIILLVYIERKTRPSLYWDQVNCSIPSKKLGTYKSFLISLICFFVFTISFLIPIFQLLKWAFSILHQEMHFKYFIYLFNSLKLSLFTCICILLLAILLAYSRRKSRFPLKKYLSQFCNLGYAVPGTILAVGVFVPIVKFDNFLMASINALGFSNPSQILNGGIFPILLAYICRFMNVGFNSINNSLKSITKSMDEASESLGIGGLKLLKQIHIPLLSSSIFTASLLLFVDLMKEMPITLMTRPFGWDTLAVRIFELTSESEWERASIPAISLVVLGLIPVILISRRQSLKEKIGNE